MAAIIIGNTESVDTLRNLYLVAENMPDRLWLRKQVAKKYFDLKSKTATRPVNRSSGCSICDKENILPASNRGNKWPFSDDYVCDLCA